TELLGSPFKADHHLCRAIIVDAVSDEFQRERTARDERAGSLVGLVVKVLDRLQDSLAGLAGNVRAAIDNTRNSLVRDAGLLGNVVKGWTLHAKYPTIPLNRGVASDGNEPDGSFSSACSRKLVDGKQGSGVRGTVRIIKTCLLPGSRTKLSVKLLSFN